MYRCPFRGHVTLLVTSASLLARRAASAIWITVSVMQLPLMADLNTVHMAHFLYTIVFFMYYIVS